LSFKWIYNHFGIPEFDEEKRVGGVAQGEGPEFKPPVLKKKK
jgi:hypothetical protein